MSENENEPTRGNREQRNQSSFAERMKKGLYHILKDLSGCRNETKTVVGGLFLMGCLFLVLVILLGARVLSLKHQVKADQIQIEELQSTLEETKAILATSSSVYEGGDADTPQEQPQEVTPEPTSKPQAAYVVCVDAGHGGNDAGAVYTPDNGEIRKESMDNLWFAGLLQKELEAYGIEVVMTRTEDVFLELNDRTDIANRADADLMISCHRNSFYDENNKASAAAQGIEIWLHNSRPQDMTELGTAMLDRLDLATLSKNRGVKYGTMESGEYNYAINRNAKMGSMIIELGFVTSEEDNDYLDRYGEQYAKEFAAAIYEWLIKNDPKQ